jgi:hypothetical protein
MEEEVIDICQSSNHDRDGLLLFDTSVLESLNKLTDEIQEGLLTDGDSDAASDSHDSDDYTDDDEDPDSGENKLFNMMDDLVMELQMELHNYDQVPVIEASDNDDVVDINDVADITHKSENEITAFQPTTQNESPPNVSIDEKDDTPHHFTHQLVPPLHSDSSMDRTNVLYPSYERAEKQRRLHMQVKQLLHRVSMITALADPEDEVTVSLTATDDVRKRGDSSIDKLEQLSDCRFSYSTHPEGKPTRTDTDAADDDIVSPTPTVSVEQANTARAMSSYTQRRRRQYLLRKQSAAANEEPVDGHGDAPAAVTPPSSTRNAGTYAKKKKRRPRTNKHKKGKHKNSSSDASVELRYQQLRQMQQMQQQSCYAQQSESIPRQSLRALLSQLLDLEEKLAK